MTDAEIEAGLAANVAAGDMIEIVDPDGKKFYEITEQGRRRVEESLPPTLVAKVKAWKYLPEHGISWHDSDEALELPAVTPEGP